MQGLAEARDLRSGLGKVHRKKTGLPGWEEGGELKILAWAASAKQSGQLSA